MDYNLIQILEKNGFDSKECVVTDTPKLLSYIQSHAKLTDDQAFIDYKKHLKIKLGDKMAKPIIDELYIIYPYGDGYFLNELSLNYQFVEKLFMYCPQLEKYANDIYVDKVNMRDIFETDKIDDNRKKYIIIKYILESYRTSNIKYDDLKEIEKFLLRKIAEKNELSKVYYIIISRFYDKYCKSFGEKSEDIKRLFICLPNLRGKDEFINFENINMAQIFNNKKIDDDRKRLIISEFVIPNSKIQKTIMEDKPNDIIINNIKECEKYLNKLIQTQEKQNIDSQKTKSELNDLYYTYMKVFQQDNSILENIISNIDNNYYLSSIIKNMDLEKIDFNYILNSTQIDKTKKIKFLSYLVNTNQKINDNIKIIEEYLKNNIKNQEEQENQEEVNEYKDVLISLYIHFLEFYENDKDVIEKIIINSPQYLINGYIPDVLKKVNLSKIFNSDEVSDIQKHHLINEIFVKSKDKTIKNKRNLGAVEKYLKDEIKRDKNDWLEIVYLEEFYYSNYDYYKEITYKEAKKDENLQKYLNILCFEYKNRIEDMMVDNSYIYDAFQLLYTYNKNGITISKRNSKNIIETLCENNNLDFKNKKLTNKILKDLQSVDKMLSELKNNEIDFEKIKEKMQKVKNIEFDYSNLSVEEMIKANIESNVAVFLHGKPGHGKSSRVYQLDPNLTEVNLSLMDLDILDGIAGIDEKTGEAIHNKPEWLKELEEKCEADPDNLHILFLEELSNASSRMQAKAYGIALDKKVAGKWDLPQNARVVAAGNEVSDSYAANEIAEPLYARFAHINIETGVEDFLRWGITPQKDYGKLKNHSTDNTNLNKIHPIIYSFIRAYGNKVFRTQYNRDNPSPFADPRRWKMASDILYTTHNPNSIEPIIGKEITEYFVNFCKLQTLSLNDVINGNYTEEDINVSRVKKLAILAKLIDVDEANLKTVRKLAKKLDLCEEFELQWIYNNPQREELLRKIKNEEKKNKEETSKKRTIKSVYDLEFGEMEERDMMLAALDANIALYLHGKPGSGKSERVRQLDPDFIELNLNHMDSEVLDGIAGIKGKETIRLKPEWLRILEEKCEKEPDKNHIVFLDELSNASLMMQTKAYGIALEKKVAGKWYLPENARVVAAGNETQDSYVANDLPEALYKRFAHIYINTTVKDWLKWAVTPNRDYELEDAKKINMQELEKKPIHPAIYSYISTYGKKVLETSFDRENPKPHADPRRWKMASDILYISNNPAAIEPIIGEELTRDFIDFCKKPKISLQDVLQDKDISPEKMKMDMATKLATIAGFTIVDESNMPKVREFVKKLGPEIKKKFEVQWAHGDPERIELLQELEMEEAEKMHEAEETKDTASSGVIAFEKIDELYAKYLKEEKEIDEPKN